QTGGLVTEGDFYPLPCAHPNCHLMCYLYRGGDRLVSVSRLLDVERHMDLIANSVLYTPAPARALVAPVAGAAGGRRRGAQGGGAAATGGGRLGGRGVGREVDGGGCVPRHADGFPGRAHVRHAPGDEVLPGAPAAGGPRRAVLRLQHAVPRRPRAAAAT